MTTAKTDPQLSAQVVGDLTWGTRWCDMYDSRMVYTYANLVSFDEEMVCVLCLVSAQIAKVMNIIRISI